MVNGSYSSDAMNSKVLALEQIEEIKLFLDAFRGERYNESVRLLGNLSFIPIDLGRVSTCAREIESIDECIRIKMPDILVAASEALHQAYNSYTNMNSAKSSLASPLATHMITSPISAQSEHLRRISDRIQALCAFAGQAKLHLPPNLYSKLTRYQL